MFEKLREILRKSISAERECTIGNSACEEASCSRSDELSLSSDFVPMVADYWYLADFINQEDAVLSGKKRTGEAGGGIASLFSEKELRGADRLDVHFGLANRSFLIRQIVLKHSSLDSQSEEMKDFEEGESGMVNLAHFTLALDSDSAKSGHLEKGSIEVSPLLVLFGLDSLGGQSTRKLDELYRKMCLNLVAGCLPEDDPITIDHLKKIGERLSSSFPALAKHSGSDEPSANNHFDTSVFYVNCLARDSEKEEKQKKESLFPRYPRRLQNPFFSDDLRLAAQRYSRGSFSRNGSLCEKYIAGIGSTDANRRIDLIDSSDNKQRAVFEEAFNPLRYPLGKWPSKYSLATMQQFAVNMYSEELYPGREWEYCPEDLMSVNGPPGTGKTTLLKEIIASAVVQKAAIMADYAVPDDMFEEKQFPEKTHSFPYRVNSYFSIKKHAEKVNDFSILVCSSNNNAVENITVELPKKNDLLNGLSGCGRESVERMFSGEASETMLWHGWGDDPKRANDEVFFSYFADELVKLRNNCSDSPMRDEERSWGLVSVPLGKKDNRRRFWKILNEITMNIRYGKAEHESAIDRYLKSRFSFQKKLEQVVSYRAQLPRLSRDELADFAASISGENGVQEFEKAHCSVPNRNGINDSMFDKFDEIREELFYYSLQLIRDFVLASMACRSNFITLLAMEGCFGDDYEYKERDRSEAMLSLMQTLFLMIPAVSSTFASVGSLFAYVKEPSRLGLLIVDEAGQALPYAAVGSMYRCRRAIVVGDPRQIEPVEHPERLGALVDLLGENIPAEHKDPGHSVQDYADAVNRFGMYSDDQFGIALWIGTPLLIHRRCEEPMFSISNVVSYGGLMVNETTESADSGLCRERSLWIEVSGPERAGKKNHFVEEQAEKALELIKDSLSCSEGVPSLFVISPFRSVCADFRKYLKAHMRDLGFMNYADPVLKAILGNIDTVHAFQGREAREVIFLLGCSEGSLGAVRWVSPNIVNVAASRAKKRLYVIGDSSLWVENSSVRKMKEILDSFYYEKADALCRRVEERNSQSNLASEPLLLTDEDVKQLDLPLDSEALSLPESVYRQYGFESKEAFDSAFDDLDDTISESVSHFVALAMKFGDVVGLLSEKDQAAPDSNAKEISLVPFWMLNTALELVFNNRVFPVIKDKRACGEYAINKINLADCKISSMTLGKYPEPIRKKSENLDKLTYGKRSCEWWRCLSREIKRATAIRNKTTHSTSVDCGKDEYRDYKEILFDGWKTEEGLSGQGILRDRETFILVKEGLDEDEFRKGCTAIERIGRQLRLSGFPLVVLKMPCLNFNGEHGAWADYFVVTPQRNIAIKVASGSNPSTADAPHAPGFHIAGPLDLESPSAWDGQSAGALKCRYSKRPITNRGIYRLIVPGADQYERNASTVDIEAAFADKLLEIDPSLRFGAEINEVEITERSLFWMENSVASFLNDAGGDICSVDLSIGCKDGYCPFLVSACEDGYISSTEFVKRWQSCGDSSFEVFRRYADDCFEVKAAKTKALNVLLRDGGYLFGGIKDGKKAVFAPTAKGVRDLNLKLTFLERDNALSLKIGIDRETNVRTVLLDCISAID